MSGQAVLTRRKGITPTGSFNRLRAFTLIAHRIASRTRFSTVLRDRRCSIKRISSSWRLAVGMKVMIPRTAKAVPKTMAEFCVVLHEPTFGRVSGFVLQAYFASFFGSSVSSGSPSFSCSALSPAARPSTAERKAVRYSLSSR